MEKQFFSYENIVRVLWMDPENVAGSLMVDVDIVGEKILCFFDGDRAFDADLITGYLNIFKESSVGFRLLSDTPDDRRLCERALAVLTLNASLHPKISALLSTTF